MVVRKADKVQRELNYAIIDEVDSILIDEARTPLIISGRGGKSSELYKSADNFARQCREGEDFTIEEKKRLSCSPIRVSKRLKDFPRNKPHRS